MTTIDEKQTTTYVPVSSIGYHPLKNYSRNNPDYMKSKGKKGLRLSLLKSRWLSNTPVPTYATGKTEIDACVNGLEKRLADIDAMEKDIEVILPATFSQEKITLSKIEIKEAFKQMYMGKKDAIVPPKGLAVYGYHRHHELVIVNAVFLKMDMPLILEIPVLASSYENELAIQVANLGENTRMKDGVVQLKQDDLIVCARRMYHQGCLQVDMRNHFNAGTGQKLHALLSLDKRYKTNKADECITDGSKFASLSKEELRKILNAQKFLDDVKANKIKVDGVTVSEGTLAEKRALCGEAKWEAYFKTPKIKKNAPPIATKTAITALAEQSPVEIIQEVLQAVVDNKLDTSLAKYIDHAVEINEAIKKIMA